jgi:Flp pilus assembly protein TadG
LAALCSVLLIGMAAIAVDQGMAYADRRGLQSATDAGALAGARSATRGATAVNHVAMQYLGKDLGFILPVSGSSGGSAVTCSSTTACPDGTYQVTSRGYSITLVQSHGYLDVSVRHTRPTLLAGVIGFATNSAGASSRVVASPTCVICVLNPTANDTAFIEGSGGFTLTSTTGEGIVVNSSDASALHAQGSGRLSAPAVSVVGSCMVGSGSSGSPGQCSSSQFSPAAVPGGQPALDPLAGLPPPIPPPTNPVPSAIDRPSTSPLQPGVYNELRITGSETSDMVLSPGVYVITGGVYINGSHNITGSGVTLYLTCGDASHLPTACPRGGRGAGIDMQSSGGVAFTAPTSGPYNGVAIFMDRNNTATISLQSQASVPVRGTIYGVSGTIAFTSNGVTNPLQSAIVIGNVLVQSTQNLTLNYDPAQNAPQLEWARTRGLVR